MHPPFCHRMNLQTQLHVNAWVSLGTDCSSLPVPVTDKHVLLTAELAVTEMHVKSPVGSRSYKIPPVKGTCVI